ncbi:MAG: hypothetical protein U0136_14325 [Bdellovibrionota bacterium]
MSSPLDIKSETIATDPWSRYTSGAGFTAEVENVLKRRVGSLAGQRILVHGHCGCWARQVCQRLGPPHQVIETPQTSLDRPLSNGWTEVFNGILCIGLPSALADAPLREVFRQFRRVAKRPSWLAVLIVNPRRVDSRFGTAEAPTQTVNVPADVGDTTLTTYGRGSNLLARCIIDPGFSMPTFDDIRSTDDPENVLPRWTLVFSNG